MPRGKGVNMRTKLELVNDANHALNKIRHESPNYLPPYNDYIRLFGHGSMVLEMNECFKCRLRKICSVYGYNPEDILKIYVDNKEAHSLVYAALRQTVGNIGLGFN